MLVHVKKILTGAVSAILSIGIMASSTWAQDRPSLQSPRSPATVLKMFDANGDQRVDRSEIRYKSIEVFDRIDSNKDGTLSAADLPGLSAAAFKAADRNGDGKLTTFEYSQAEFLQFDNIDIDKDGFITASEIAAYRKRPRPR